MAYPSAFAESQSVLRDLGFTIDRKDFRFGRVTSHPKGSPTVFEPWKADNTHADQAWASTLGDQRRTVVVSFTPEQDRETEVGGGKDRTETTPSGSPESYALSVEVLLERLQVPQRRMNGSAGGAVFADLAEVPEELQARGIVDQYWQPIGRDLHLEKRLLKQILARIEDGPGHP
ncbi:MAG: hypothetical protein AAGH99_04145 [Planctomycetota bacterium]